MAIFWHKYWQLKEVENLRRELIANVSMIWEPNCNYKRLSGNFTNQRKRLLMKNENAI
jgi:hypothetical protein